MARPSKLTPDTQRWICDALRLGVTYELAAASAGIHYDTFRAWRKSKPAFSAAIREAEGAAATRWLAQIEKAATGGDWRAAAWKLERRYPRDYGRSMQDQRHSGDVKITIQRVNDWRQRDRVAGMMAVDEDALNDGE